MKVSPFRIGGLLFHPESLFDWNLIGIFPLNTLGNELPSFSGNAIGDEGAEALAKALTQNTMLRNIELCSMPGSF